MGLHPSLSFKLVFSLFILVASTSIYSQISWEGGIGDWHDPSNWDGGQVPTLNDQVIIKEGEVFVSSGNSAFAQSLITYADLLIIEANAGLSIERGFDGTAIHNEGVLIVDGTLRVSEVTDQGAIGILNNGELINHGVIDCQRMTAGTAIINKQQIINEGDINIADCGTWCFDNKGNLENEGLIDIRDTDQHGLICSETGMIGNRGEMFIDCQSQGVYIYGRLDNATGATVRIDNIPGVGYACLMANRLSGASAGGIVDNRGIIITNGGERNIYVSGFLDNRGKIEATESSNSAIHIAIDGRVRNYRQIRIFNNNGNGINTTGLFINRRLGTVLQTDSDLTHVKINSQGEFRNFGLLSLDDSGQKNIDNEGVFNNFGHGRLTLYNEVETHAGSNFNNFGHIFSDYNGSNIIASNTFTNQGVLGDKTASFSNITNSGVHVLPIGPGVIVGEPTSDALGLGNISGFSIGTWRTIQNSQSMGNYNTTDNTFTPNSNALGETEFMVRIRINSVNKSSWYRVPVVDGVQAPSSSFQGPALNRSVIAPLDIQIYPNPTTDNLTVTIPPHFETKDWIAEVVSASGQLIQSAKYSKNSSFTIAVDDLPQGVYTLRVSGAEHESIRKFVKKNENLNSSLPITDDL